MLRRTSRTLRSTSRKSPASRGSGSSLSASTTLSYRSKTQQFELRNDYLDQPGYALWDASLVWTSVGDRGLAIELLGQSLDDLVVVDLPVDHDRPVWETQ